MSSERAKDYHGLVDMGSNGIRFSITDLSPATQRTLPTVFLDRAGISLYDVQWENGQQVPIPDAITGQVIQALQRFKSICKDWDVPENQIRIVATEATRKAENSEHFRARIKDAVGWEVELLPKDEEGRIGAYGVASSYDEARGVVMDLGGGSTQISWIKTENGEVKMSDVGSVSLPYGAAALTKALQMKTRKTVAAEVVKDLKEAVESIAIPDDLAQSGHERGLNLYLSGGGFRGWGFVLMSEHPIKPYPIPIINGFHSTTAAFHDTDTVTAAVQRVTGGETPDIFRISERRAGQIPAVAFLVKCLAQVLPDIKDVYFCQGGVREGTHFANLSPTIRAQNPYVAATLPLATKSTPDLVVLLSAAVHRATGVLFGEAMLQTFVQTMYVHTAFPKDIAAGAALRSTTTGYFANVHGVSHRQRVVLALLLCERYGGFKSISPTEQDFYRRLVRLLDEEQAWWCMFLGRVAGVLAYVYPAGVVREERVRVKVEGLLPILKKSKADICIDFTFQNMEGALESGLVKAVKGVAKVGKKKNWVGKKGYKVLVTIDGKEVDNGGTGENAD